MKRIKIGDWTESLIEIITLGNGEGIAMWIAELFGYSNCGCCERKQWLNKLTNPDYDGECNKIKLI